MRKSVLFFIFGVLFPALYGVTLEQRGDDFTVKNGNYTVVFEKKQNYTAKVTHFGVRKALHAQALPTFTLDGELDQYEKRYNPASEKIFRKQRKSTAKVLLNTAEKVQLCFQYSFSGGTVQEILSFDDSCGIRYDITAAYTKRLMRHALEVTLNERSGKGYFLPDGQRISGIPGGYGKNAAGMNYCAAVYPDSSALGVMPASTHGLAGLEYAMTGVAEGETSERAFMRVVYSRLSQNGSEGKFQCSYYLMAAADAETVRMYAEQAIPRPELELFSFETAKLITRPGKMNEAVAEIRNNGKTSAEAAVKITCIYGLDSEKVIAEEKITLESGSRKTVRIPIPFTPDMTLGMAIRCDLIRDGAVLASGTDFCSVSDFAPRDSGFGIVNAGQVFKPEHVKARNRVFKKKYIGAYEYYCWAESTIGALAPEHDSWIPNTEASYSHVLTKDFLKGLISDAHENGVHVFSWITGLWNFKYALNHPDRIQYSKNGEPNIYGGSVYPDGRRRAVLKANYFTPERAAEWGNEMADSVDMFGWDGCRWDYTFVPSIKCDPLYAGDAADDWYDHRGVPQSKLYPDPDKTGQIALTAWRNAVQGRHPEFIYGTNFPSGKDKWEKHPLYHQTMANRGLCLFEDMLKFYNDYNTFERWGDELAQRCDLVRKYQGTCAVGYMGGLDVGGTAYNLANYTAIGAGVKWWSNSRYEIEYLMDAERNRFALRYAKYFYGTEYFRASGIAKIPADVNVLYRPFLRQSVKNGQREIVMPILNMPEGKPYICQYHKDPPVRKQVSVTVPLGAGEQLESVYLMTPQSPEKAVKLSIQGNTFVIPEIKDAVLAVAQVKK